MSKKVTAEEYNKAIISYENKDPRCDYQFTPDPLGYCWGYATAIDRGKEDAFVKERCPHCDLWIEEKPND